MLKLLGLNRSTSHKMTTQKCVSLIADAAMEQNYLAFFSKSFFLIQEFDLLHPHVHNSKVTQKKYSND